VSQNPTIKAHFALFFVNTLYGASHVVAKDVLGTYLEPSVFILFRVTGATVLFWSLKMLFNRQKVEKKDFLLLALCGLFGVALNQLFFFYGLRYSSAINSGIIMAANPIMVLILSMLILREGSSLLRIGGILIGATGVVLLTLQNSTSSTDASWGDFFLFVNALSYAFYLILAKPLMKKYSPLTVITYVFTFGLAFVLLFPPTITNFLITPFETFTQGVWLKIIYVIVGVTFLTYLLTIYGLKYLSPAVSSVYIYIQPIMVILFAFLFAATGISEDQTHSVTFIKILLMIMIFSGVYLTTRESRYKQ
jgi:drug/metabolite transporter (DMT)-like permease